MACWIGVDVGGKRKGFDVAVIDERRLVRLLGGLDREAVLGLVDAERLFPTASWTRWFGASGAMKRSAWSTAGVVRLGLDGIPNRTNQDQRDAIAAAMTARQQRREATEAIGEIVVPTALPVGGQPLPPSYHEQPATGTARPSVSASHRSSSETRPRQRRGAPLDFDRAAAFISAIPTGRWAAYKDVATAGGNHMGAQAVEEWVRRNGDVLPNVYRVIRSTGFVADGYRPAGADLPGDGAAVRDILQREGVRIDAHGRASKQQRITLEDWRRAGAKAAET